jgi:hypothetical protein
MAGSPQAAEAMALDWFRSQGLLSLTERYLALQHQLKPPDTLSTSGGARGRAPQGALLLDFPALAGRRVSATARPFRSSGRLPFPQCFAGLSADAMCIID